MTRQEANLTGAMVVFALLLSLASCATVNTSTDPLVLLAQAEKVLGTAAHTLADAGDAGILERGTDDYDKTALALLDAGEYLDKGWALYAAGDVAAALESREAAMALYMKVVRPTLVKYSLEDE